MERKLPFQWQHNEFREAFGAFLDKEAVPYYDEWCNNHGVPHSYFEKMGQAGFMAMWVDKKYGGAGCTGDFLYTVIKAEEYAKRMASTASSPASPATSSPPTLPKTAPEEQRRKWRRR